MDLPDFWFSDSPVPPLPGQRAHGHDLNKRSIIPVIKDAVLDRPTDFKSLSIKYPVTAANGNTVMRPLSTCLPFGVPNRLSNLQDLCSSIIPFAIQSQEWIRESRYGAEQTTDSQGDSDKRQLRRSLSGSEAGGANSRLGNGDDNFSDAESSDEDPRSVGQTHGFPKDEETDVLHHDWLLPLSDLPCIPDYRRFKPYQKDIERMEEAAKRAAVYCGFGRVNRLASPLNWWYSGGCLAYFGFEPDSGYLLHPSASLSLLETTPVNVTGKRSFKRIVSSGHKPQDTQLEESIYQIVTQCMETVDSALVGARLSKEVILLQMKNIAAPELTIKRVIKAEHQDYFSHISASPYIQGEFLSASQDGKVSIWSVEREEHICGFDVQHMGFCELAQNHWIGCYFGNYPRSTGVVTSSAVELFDGRLRSQNTAQLELLRKAHYMNGVQDDIVAADLLAANTSYHMILSTKEFLLVDQRFSKRPAIRYPLQCTTPALYLRCAKGSSGAPNCIFAGSQMSQMAMCFELEDALESKPSSLGSLPFCTAAPRQLVPLAQLAGLHVDFSMKQRLEKPIIGIEVIPQGNDLGVTLAMVSSLGDLFMQSYEIVEKEGYDPDGVAAFSAVHPDVQLKKAEAGHLNKWLTAASAAVADPSSRLHLRLFNPDKSSCISEEMSGYLTRCSQAVVRQPHPHCGRCNEVSDIPEDAVVDKNVTCPRCHGPVCASRRRHMNGDGSKRFVFVEEVNDDEPIVLPENFQIAEERLREMALHNRIIHRILTKCYGENIDSSLLEPQANQMTPSMQQKSREESKNVDQVELTKMFLENCEKTVPTNAVVADEQVEGDETDDFQEEVLHGTTFDHGECVDVMHDVGDWLRFDPFATATQQDPLDLNAGTIITMQTPLLDRYLIKSTATPPNSPPKEHDPITNPLRENPRSPKKTSDPTTLRSPRKPKNAPLVRNSPLGKGKKSQGRPRKDENLDKLEDFVRDADSIQQQFANASLYTPKKKELPLLEGSEESDAVIDVRSHHITPEPEKRAVKRNLRVISGSPLFPTRRTSQRQLELGKKLQEEQQETLKVHNMILKGRDDKRIQVCEFPDKGRGLIASAAFKKNEFVVEYAGDLLTASQAEQREMRYLQAAEKFGCYMYFFCHRGQKWCVDATAETGRYGRLLNHSRYEANLTPEVIEVRQKPYIILRASRDIDIGEELVYDYGERRPAQLAMFPWLKD